MGDNVITSGGDRQFQDQIVFGIGQERPPQVENVLQVSYRTQVIQQFGGLLQGDDIRVAQ
jgi:hypothetical protein